MGSGGCSAFSHIFSCSLPMLALAATPRQESTDLCCCHGITCSKAEQEVITELWHTTHLRTSSNALSFPWLTNILPAKVAYSSSVCNALKLFDGK